MSENERSPFEYIDLTPEQIERFRETIPDLGDKAFLMVNRYSGQYLVAWEYGDTKYQYDPLSPPPHEPGRNVVTLGMVIGG